MREFMFFNPPCDHLKESDRAPFFGICLFGLVCSVCVSFGWLVLFTLSMNY